MNKAIEIALIGDVHRQFDQHDITQFNQSDYDLLLFTGDLANYRHREGIAVARQMAELQTPALIIPGNHDTLTAPQLLAEIKQWPRLRRWLAWGQPFRLRQWQRALGQVQVGGYSAHPVPGAEDVAVLVGRQFAMGGSVLHCQPQLQRQFGIGTMAESAARLCQLVEQTSQQKLIFLAHNGPTGLGSRPDSIWGNDFQAGGGDFGDSDLRETIAFAQAQGKTVLAVVAGHMHQHVKTGGQRTWHLVQDGIHYINAARVPRIFGENGRTHHHHIRLTIDDNSVTVREQLCQGNDF
ncbi:MAG: metallophosphoesterase [Ardenticatenaceae bacterium]|nr:metallophosphoesterase [Ardenticatenaceae bacterium]MCB8949400.1 metallophosphoesterase [Ardenticatenaceae bacterium]